jgi:hypothetical protein
VRTARILAACGALRTFAAHSGIGLLRWWTMPRPPSAIAACKVEAAGGRSGLGPRTHEEKPLSSDAPCPRLEGPALPDPPRPRPCSLPEDRRQGPPQARHERRHPKPAPGCWKCTSATSKVEVVGGRAGLGPRGAGTAHRTTAASLRVFEGPALNGPPRPRPCAPRWRRADGAWSNTEAAACQGVRRTSAKRRKPPIEPGSAGARRVSRSVRH